jgi:hypothetical protein
MKIIYLIFYLLVSSTVIAQTTYSRHYDQAGNTGSDRGGNMSWVGDGFIFPILSFCGSTSCFRFLKLDDEGTIQWYLDLLSEDSVAVNPCADFYRLDDGSYVTLYYRVYFGGEERFVIHWLNFDEDGIIADFVVSDTSYVEAVCNWEPIPEGFLAWINRGDGQPMVARKYSQTGETLAEWVHDETVYSAQFGGNIVPLPDGGYLYLNQYAEPGDRETLWGRRDAQGQIIWEHQNELVGLNFDSENIILTTDNLVVVADEMDRTHPLTDINGDYVIHGQDLNGNFLWDHSFNHLGDHAIHLIIPAANGDIIGAGYWYVQHWQGQEGDTRAPAWLFRMNPQGEILWNRYFLPAAQPQYDYRFYDVVELPDGRIAASGHYIDTFPNGALDFGAWLVVTDENGCLYPEDCEQDILVSSEDMVSLSAPVALDYFRLRTNPVASGTPWSLDWTQAPPHRNGRFLLFDLSGKPVGNWSVGKMLTPPTLAAGIYQLVLQIDGRIVQTVQ